MLGKVVSHYKILEKLGGGGMGVVYCAEDLHLERTAALKFLSPHLSSDDLAKERFKREARAASALNHPNICTIYDIDEEEGRLFIAMAHYDGRTLKKVLKDGDVALPEVLDYVRQIAVGLDAAHQKGIIHRDIKPANVFLTRDNRIVILDFGLAKLVGATDITASDYTVGTFGYMSPEQIRGEAVDRRSDLWSLGVVFYELLAGKRPFQRDYEQATMYAILNEEPDEPLTLHSPLDQEVSKIVGRLLAKQVEARYDSAGELVRDLEDLAGGGTVVLERPQPEPAAPAAELSRRPCIVVLPFTDMSKEKDQEYFCDGIAEELIDALSHVDDWRVISRTTSFSFKNQSVDLRDIGTRLSAS
ncbi:MAG: serine/threonine-protein kinase, partial [Rhodothermales bacterium]|nr:serine/threonine-protein kinase [Rhodothermales bacterium]